MGYIDGIHVTIYSIHGSYGIGKVMANQWMEWGTLFSDKPTNVTLITETFWYISVEWSYDADMWLYSMHNILEQEQVKEMVWTYARQFDGPYNLAHPQLLHQNNLLRHGLGLSSPHVQKPFVIHSVGSLPKNGGH